MILTSTEAARKGLGQALWKRIGHQLDNSLKSILARFMWVFGVLRTEG